MRVMYRVVGGRLPFGFMSELQVSLAQMHVATEDPHKALHFAPETPVNRIAGSVLSVVYDLGDAIIKEWAFISQGQSDLEHANADAHGYTMDCVRVMGWAELVHSSPEGEGASDWRLFRGAMQKIEDMAKSQPWLCLQKFVLYVDSTGHPSKPVEVECTGPQNLTVLSFTLASGEEVTVRREDIIPSGTKVRLEAAQARSNA